MKKKIRVALSGDKGRMGQSLKKNIRKDAGKCFADGANTKKDPKSWNPKEIDGVIDFSLPPLFSKTLKWCVDNKKPFVSGTTGLSSSKKEALKKASQKIPVFYAENMSWGIFLMSKWISEFSGDKVSITMEDIHHKDKKDKPSGTALRLKKSLPKVFQNKLQIKSHRKGKEFGIHKIFFKTKEENLTIEHQALSRDVFSKGALKALDFILKKKKGFYSLEDIYQ